MRFFAHPITCQMLPVAAILLLLTGCGLLQQLSGFQRPTLRFKTLHLANVSFSAMTLDFEFEVDNPNSIGLTLVSAANPFDQAT